MSVDILQAYLQPVLGSRGAGEPGVGPLEGDGAANKNYREPEQEPQALNLIRGSRSR